MTEKVEKKKLIRINRIASILLTTILMVIIIAYGINWYYERIVLPSEIDSGIDITKSKLYFDHRADIVRRAETQLKEAKSEYERWLAIGDLSIFLVDEGKIENAESFANQLLEIAPRYRDSWNYGNAIHKAHISLGRIELRRNNIDRAKQHLLEAGHIPGSPQLNSFGPKMLLAKELLEKGEKEVVLQYIELCSKFWESGKTEIKIWKDIIGKGRIPNFQALLI